MNVACQPIGALAGQYRVMMAVVVGSEELEVSVAGDTLEELHAAHYRSLVRLAALLLTDVGASEEVVQDAFVNTMRRWARIRESDKVVAYLRSAVLNGARKRLARRSPLPRLRALRSEDAGAADAGVADASRRDAMLSALRSLPARQRECLALRFYLDLSEAEIATTLGISAGSVKSNASRAMAGLHAKLGGTR